MPYRDRRDRKPWWARKASDVAARGYVKVTRRTVIRLNVAARRRGVSRRALVDEILRAWLDAHA